MRAAPSWCRNTHPHLAKARNPHILMNSPPLDLREKWFAGSTGYSMAKYGMSLVVLGLAGELREQGHRGQRTVAAHHHPRQRQESARPASGSWRCRASPRSWRMRPISSSRSLRRNFTGHFLIRRQLPRGEGVTDFEQYKWIQAGARTHFLCSRTSRRPLPASRSPGNDGSKSTGKGIAHPRRHAGLSPDRPTG